MINPRIFNVFKKKKKDFEIAAVNKSSQTFYLKILPDFFY